MKDKYLFILMVPLFVVLTIFSCFMVTKAVEGPISLSTEEAAFYEAAATNYLNHEKAPNSSNANETLKYIQGRDKVTVMSHNIFKETLTASLENGEIVTKVNAPNVDFTGCIIFHSLLGTAAFVMAVVFGVAGINEFGSSKRKSEAR